MISRFARSSIPRWAAAASVGVISSGTLLNYYANADGGAKGWSSADVSKWLGDVGLSMYASKFREQNVDGDILTNDLTEEIATSDLGVKRLHAKKLMRQVKNLSGGSPCAKKKAADRFVESQYGGLALGDDKDTENFRYFTYPSRPKFTSKHRSAMAKFLTPEIWNKYKDKKTSTGYTFSNAIQTGVETPHLGVGVTAGDEESWDLFQEYFYPIIEDWHKWDPYTNDHVTDLDYRKLKFSKQQKRLFNQYVLSTRIRAARNISGFRLPAGANVKDRNGVEALLSGAFADFKGELKGTYYALGKLTDAQRKDLRSNGFLFQKPRVTNLLTWAGAARSWPDGRGIYHNDDRTVLCWVNEEDHCRIIGMSKDGDIRAVFKRFGSISDALSDVAAEQGISLMSSPKLGWLGTCPSNLGTGMRASVMIKLPELNKDPRKLEELCEKYDLQPRGSAGEHSAAKGGKWDISNKQRIGFTEVELVQKVIDGVTELIKIEQGLAKANRAS